MVHFGSCTLRFVVVWMLERLDDWASVFLPIRLGFHWVTIKGVSLMFAGAHLALSRVLCPPCANLACQVLNKLWFFLGGTLIGPPNSSVSWGFLAP